jgi:hypothetical protein
MKNILLLLIVFVFVDCKKHHDDLGSWIYKTKGDYFYLVSFRMEEDNDDFEVVTGPTHDTLNLYRDRLIEGYVRDRECLGERTGFFSFTFGEYRRLYGLIMPHTDSLKKYILDKDPFIELYYIEDGNEYNDTVLLNDIIRKGELSIKLKKLK